MRTKTTFGMVTVIYPCRYLFVSIVPIIFIFYRDLNGMNVYIQYADKL